MKVKRWRRRGGKMLPYSKNAVANAHQNKRPKRGKAANSPLKGEKGKEERWGKKREKRICDGERSLKKAEGRNPRNNPRYLLRPASTPSNAGEKNQGKQCKLGVQSGSAVS